MMMIVEAKVLARGENLLLMNINDDLLKVFG